MSRSFPSRRVHRPSIALQRPENIRLSGITPVVSKPQQGPQWETESVQYGSWQRQSHDVKRSGTQPSSG